MAMKEYFEFKTTDFTHENIHKLICEKYGELFIDVKDIEHAIANNHIEIHKDKFVFKF